MSLIPQTDIDRVREAANIVDVISDHVSLRKKGVNYFCRCPFHNEKTESLSVSPSKQVWKCFGCGKSGNVFSFIEEIETVSFAQAVRIVAKKYNVEIRTEEQTPEEIEREKRRDSLYIILDQAKDIYRKNLLSDKEANDYLESRNIKPEILEKFGVGAAFSWNGLHTQMKNAGYNEKLMEDAGLIKEGNHEKYDYFRKRVVFPFMDIRGRVIGFTGRNIDPSADKKTAKYLNSPETELFKKSNALFGLFQAKQSISLNDKVYLVEGQFDVFSFVQSGVANTVCGSGTAMPAEQIKQLLRFTNNVTLIYDPDAAGNKAAIANIEKLVEAGVRVRAVSLPEDKDPDQFAQNIGDKLPVVLSNKEVSFVVYLYDKLHSDKDEAKQDEAINTICKIIAKVSEESLRDRYISRLSELSSIDHAIIQRKVKENSTKIKPVESDMNDGFHGIEEAREMKSEEFDSCIITTKFSEFSKSLDEEPIIFLKGIPSESNIQQLRTISTNVELYNPDISFDEKKECSTLTTMKELFKAKFTVNIELEDTITGFINYYIRIYSEKIAKDRPTEDVINIYLARVAEMISYAPETTRIRQTKEWANLLGLPNEKSLKDIVKPFLDQRKAKRNLDREQLDVEANLSMVDTERIPSYVLENEDYMRMYRRYGFYPLVNNNNIPVSYMFKTDSGSHTRVSDFYMEPLLHICSPDKESNKRVMKLNHLYFPKPTYVEWKSSILANMSTFEEMLINEGAFNFENGDAKQFKKIRQFMSYEFQKCYELKVFGQQKEDFFAFANGIFHEVDGSYRIDKTDNLGVVEHEGEHYYSPAFSEIYSRERSDTDRYAQDRWLVYNDVPEKSRITFEEWASLMDRVYSVNDNGKWAVIYAIMCCFRSDIHPIDRLFTSLFFIGPTQSGKTQIAVSIRSLFISPDAPSFNLCSGTDAAFFSILERFRDVPQIMEEYNDEMISDNKFQGLKSVTYDGDGKQKRKSATGNDVETSQVNAPVILLGQEAPQKDDNALSNRVVLREVPKREDINSPEAKAIFQKLKDAEKAGLCYLLFEVLKLRSLFRSKFKMIQRECNKKLHEQMDVTSNKGGEQTRVINTISLFTATCKLLEEHAPHLKLPFTYEEFFNMGVETVRNQVDLISRTDKLAQFFHTVDYLIDKGSIIYGREFKIETPGKITIKGVGERILQPIETKVIYINLSNTHKMYSLAASGEKPLTLTTLEMNLKSHPAYLGTVSNTRFRWNVVREIPRGEVVSEEEGKTVTDNSMKKVVEKFEKQTSAMVLNYDILKRYMDIDFERNKPDGEDDNLPF